MKVVRDPDPEATLAFLAAELAGLASRRGHLLQLVADCEVAYHGRARSDLSRGERLILLKPDGTLLVHTASKSKPVNWQPPGAAFHAAVEDGHVVLTSHRLKPDELVRVTFHAVRLLVSVPLRDAADLALVGSEDDLQQLLFENPELVEPGFRPRRRERDTDRGFWDLDGDDLQGRRVVVEVKRGAAGIQDAQQLWRYVEELRKLHPDCRGILVAAGVAPKARKLLASCRLEWREVEWTSVLPQIQAMRHGGQASLQRFAARPPLDHRFD